MRRRYEAVVAARGSHTRYWTPKTSILHDNFCLFMICSVNDVEKFCWYCLINYAHIILNYTIFVDLFLYVWNIESIKSLYRFFCRLLHFTYASCRAKCLTHAQSGWFRTFIWDRGAYKDVRSMKQTAKDNHLSTMTIVNCRPLEMLCPASYNGTCWLLIYCTIFVSTVHVYVTKIKRPSIGKCQ
jgi:hypothetical protein